MSHHEGKLRPLSEITQEYNQLCFRAGNLQYSIHIQSNDLKQMNDALRSLNIEAAKAAEESKAAAEAAALSQPPTLVQGS